MCLLSDPSQLWKLDDGDVLRNKGDNGEQKWKLDGNRLKNKAGLWKSVNSWTFTTKDDDPNLIYIENNSTTEVFGATSDGKVIQEDKEEGKALQLWKKGKADDEGYYTLENSKVPKVITAVSPDSLEVKGNITLRFITTFKSNCLLFPAFFSL